MIIKPCNFDAGVEFTVRASTEAERMLLLACVDGVTFQCGDDETEFILKLRVSN